jgi:hypothetical protein
MVLARGTAALAVTVCVAGVLTLAGCSSGDGGSPAEPTGSAGGTGTASSVRPSPGSPTPVPSVSSSVTSTVTPSGPAPGSASATPVPVTGPDQKLVTMTVTGGFAGVNQKVVLRGDGTVRTTDRGESEVERTTTAEFTELRTLLGDPALDDVPAFTIGAGADRFQYTLQFEGRTVMTDRSGDEPALDRLIDALSALLPGN